MASTSQAAIQGTGNSTLLSRGLVHRSMSSCHWAMSGLVVCAISGHTHWGLCSMEAYFGFFHPGSAISPERWNKSQLQVQVQCQCQCQDEGQSQG